MQNGGYAVDARDRIKVMLDEFAYMPERAHSDDAGLDLRSPGRYVLKRGKSVLINTGVHVGIPEGHVGMLKSKSGLMVRYGLQNEGVIDAGYTGAIVVKLYNWGERDIMIEKGDKISQLVILPIITPEVELVDVLSETERGSNGFGSTGR